MKFRPVTIKKISQLINSVYLKMKLSGHIHVVDDSPEIRRLLTMILGQQGYSIDTHDSATAYLRSNVSQQPEIMILDVRMPGMTGVELQAHLKALGRNIPIVFISGGCSPTELETIQAAGCVDFLWKPFTTEQLTQAVHKGFAIANGHKVP